jgi:hypothetical protein
MKAILTSALAVGLCVVAFAQDKADPVGTWKCEYEIRGQKRESTLTIGKHADAFVGTMKWPDQAEAKLADVKVKDGEVTFSAVRELMDQKIHLKYTMKVEGDKIKGKGERASGDPASFDIEGKREKPVGAKDAKKGK